MTALPRWTSSASAVANDVPRHWSRASSSGAAQLFSGALSSSESSSSAYALVTRTPSMVSSLISQRSRRGCSTVMRRKPKASLEKILTCSPSVKSP